MEGATMERYKILSEEGIEAIHENSLRIMKEIGIVMPYDPAKELLAAVRAITRKTSEVDTKLTFGNITLDRSTFELSSPSGSVRLANKEFQMLEMLMSGPKNVISVDQFMDHIWGYDTDTESNVVWVYISYLRKKLAALDADVRIKASRNAGYSLEIITE